MSAYLLSIVLVAIGMVLGYLVGRADRAHARDDEVLAILERIYEQRGRRP